MITEGAAPPPCTSIESRGPTMRRHSPDQRCASRTRLTILPLAALLAMLAGPGFKRINAGQPAPPPFGAPTVATQMICTGPGDTLMPPGGGFTATLRDQDGSPVV